MNSSGHRANILNCGFRNIGIGLAYDGTSARSGRRTSARPARVKSLGIRSGCWVTVVM